MHCEPGVKIIGGARAPQPIRVYAYGRDGPYVEWAGLALKITLVTGGAGPHLTCNGPIKSRPVQGYSA